jgi:hypothetical protein
MVFTFSRNACCDSAAPDGTALPEANSAESAKSVAT